MTTYPLDDVFRCAFCEETQTTGADTEAQAITIVEAIGWRYIWSLVRLRRFPFLGIGRVWECPECAGYDNEL